MILFLIALLSLTDGAVLKKRQAYNNTQLPFQQQFPSYPQQGGQQQGGQVPFVPQQVGQQLPSQPFPKPPPFTGQQPFIPQQGGQQVPFVPQQGGQQLPFVPQQGGQQQGGQQPYYPQFPGQQTYYPQYYPHHDQQRLDDPAPVAEQSTAASETIPIVKLEIRPNQGDGSYEYSYETGNGIKAEEKGSQKAVGDPAELGTVAVGSYSYKDPEGNEVSVRYTADENGFVPVGSHIPTPPPIPKEILEALEQNAAEEAAQNNGNISPSYRYFFDRAYNRQR